MAKKKKINQSQYGGKILGRVDEKGNKIAFIQNPTDEEDIAPVKQTNNTWFKKGTLDDSGYAIENPIDAINRINAGILMTGVDALGQFGRGFLGSAEGVTDIAKTTTADVLDFFGADNKAKKLRESAERTWGVNEQLDQALASDNGTGIDDMSFLGEKGKTVPQGLGTTMFSMTTGGLGGALLGTTAGASATSMALLGMSAAGNSEQEAIKEMKANQKINGLSDKEIYKNAKLYGVLSGIIETGTEMMFGAAAQGSQLLGIGTGAFDEADDAVINALTKKISNKMIKTFTQAGLKATSEGVEEVASGFLNAWAKKLTYMKQEDIKKLIEDENLLDSFLSGTFSAALSQAPSVARNITTTENGKLRLQTNDEIRDFITNLNEQEQQVVEREIENRLEQEENVSKKRRSEIEKQVIEDLDRGYISANTIRDVLGENYNAERDVRLNESFNEETRRTQAYENDLSKYDEKQAKVIQKAIDSGLLNNSNKTHDFVDLIAKISADKGVDFDFTNNERINESGFGIKGKTVNGYVKDGTINLNLESNQALNKTVGHEITHVLEGTDVYKELQNSLKSYLGEREWNNRIDELAETYKNVENANIENELTSDLVGEYVFNDEKFVKSLSTKNPNLFQKIFDEIKYMLKIATAGSKEARDLEKVKRAFEKAYRETSKTQEGTQYQLDNQDEKYQSILTNKKEMNLGSYQEGLSKTDKSYRYNKVNSYDIKNGGRGDNVQVAVTKNGYIANNALLSDNVKGKGEGTKIMLDLNQQSLEETGYPLRSLPEYNIVGIKNHTAEGQGLWDSLVRKGFAVKNNDNTYTMLETAPTVEEYVKQRENNTQYSVEGKEEVSLSYAKQRFNRNMGKYSIGDNLEDAYLEHQLRKEELDSLYEYAKKKAYNDSQLKELERRYNELIERDNPNQANEIQYSLTDNQNNESEKITLADGRTYNNYYEYAKDITKNKDELAKELLFKHYSQNFDVPANSNETKFYHGTDATFDYDGLKVMDFDEQTMDRNYGDYFYITTDKDFSHTYGSQIAEFIIPNDKILSLEDYRQNYSNKTDEELFNNYWALEMPDNEYIVKDIKPIIDYSKQRANDYINQQENSQYSLTDNQGRELSKEQQEYFKDSKARDEDGRLLELYHGSKARNVNIFEYSPERQTGTDYGEAYYFTSDYNKAKGYQYDANLDERVANHEAEHQRRMEKLREANFSEEARKEFLEWSEQNKIQDILNDEEYIVNNVDNISGETKKVYLNLTNPLMVDAKGEYYFNVYPSYFEEARKNGNDGIIVKNVIDNPRGEARPIDTYIAFKNNQFKNVDNTNPTSNPDIRYSLSEDAETFKTPYGVEVVKNPSTDDYIQMRQDILEEYPWLRGEKILRQTYDEEGNVYYWNAYDAQHADVEPYINKKYNTRTFQNDGWWKNPIYKDSPKDYSYVDTSNFKYSLSDTDSQGKELTQGQKDFFKDVSSEVKDENNQLMRFYHGSNSEFTIFDLTKGSQSNSNAGVGFWFTPSMEGARNFADSVWYGDKTPTTFEVYLNMKNPKVYETYDNTEIRSNLKEQLDNTYKERKALTDKYSWETPSLTNLVSYMNYMDDAKLVESLKNNFKFKEENAKQYVEDAKKYIELNNQYKNIEKQFDDARWTDAYEQFRTDIYKIAGKSADDANTGGTGMALDNKEQVLKDYVNSLKEQGYDGIVIKNTAYDSNTMGGTNNQYVVFDPNQIKNVTNENPTDNVDIRYQLGNNEVSPTSGWNVRSEDVRLQSAFKEAIAPLQEQVQELTKTIQNIVPSRALTEEEANEYATQTQEAFENEPAPIRNNLTEEENQRMDMLEFLERNNMMNEERRYEKEQLENKINPVYPTEESTPGQALSDIRDMDEIGKRDVKAYQFEHPEVKPYFQEEARGMLNDLNNSIKGERFINESQQRGQGTSYDVIGVKRFTSPEIAKLLDSKYGYTYDDIRKGLNAIIEDHGAENIAIAKRIELVLDDNLRNGYTDWQTGMEVPPNQQYLNMLAEQEWQNYFDDINSQYPLEQLQEPQYNLEDEETDFSDVSIEPDLSNFTADDIDVSPFLEGLQGASKRQAERQQLRNELNEKREVKVPKQSDGRKAWNKFKSLFVNEFAVIDDYAKQTGNKDIKFKADTYNNYQAIAQSNIETAQTDINGKAIGRSGNSIFEEAKSLGLEDTFDEYLKQWANVDRAKQGKGAANYSAKESYKIVKEMEAKNPKLKKLGNDMWQYYRNARHNLRDAGIISQEVSDMLGRMYPHYTPYISENIENYFTDKGELKPKATIKRAKGGAAIGSLLSAEEAMQRYTKSEFNTILGNDLYREIVNTSNDIVQLGGDDRGMQFVNADNLYADKNGYYLTAYEDGNPITARISEEMYETLTRETKNRVNDLANTFSIVTKPLAWLSNVRRNILTSWSPTFMAKNFIKDAQEAVINSKYTKDMVANYSNPQTWIELIKGGGESDIFKNNYGSGLTMGQFDIDLDNYNPNAKNFNFLKGIKNANELIELAPRYAEFKASRQNGCSIQEAMYNAREVTTNFSRGGVITKAFNKYGMTFLNSSVQGFDKFIRNFSGENGAKGIVNSLAKAAIFGIAPAVFNELAFGTGDDKDEEYEALPDYIKDNYYIIKTGDGNFIRIPKGRVLSVFGSAARRTIEAMEGEENAFEGYWNNVQQQIGVNNPEENNIFAPLIQATGGRKLDSGQTAGSAWYGGDIIPSRLQKERPEDQYDASIDKLSIWLGQHTGISPYKINYVLDQYTGGMGDIFLPTITPEANSDGSIIAPIKDQFTADTITDNKYVSEFYDTKGKLYTGSKATDEDILKNKYMNSISSEMAKLYAERREVQADDSLTKQQKYAKSQAIKAEINRLAKEGMDNYNNIITSNNYAKIGDTEYYKNANGQWTKTTDDVASLGLDTEEKSEYYKVKNDIYTTKKENDGNDKPLVVQDIVNSNLTPDAKVNLYTSNYKDELIQPLVDSGMDVDSYLTFKSQSFTADKDSNGKSISGSKKQKVFDYINSMDVPYEQKLILAKSEYNSFNDNNYEIIEYIENTGMDYDERIELYKALGFKVDGDSISW